MKKSLFLILVLVMLLSFALVATAQAAPELQAVPNGVVTPMYTYLNSVGAGLTINSSGVASCSYMASTAPNYQITITANLQQSSTGMGNWYTYTSWSEPKTAAVIDKTKTCSVAKGYYYRLAVYAYVYNSSGTLVDSGSCFSPVSYY